MDRRREGLPHNLKEGPKPKYVKLVMLTTVQSNPIQSNPLDTTRSIQSHDTHYYQHVGEILSTSILLN